MSTGLAHHCGREHREEAPWWTELISHLWNFVLTDRILLLLIPSSKRHSSCRRKQDSLVTRKIGDAIVTMSVYQCVGREMKELVQIHILVAPSHIVVYHRRIPLNASYKSAVNWRGKVRILRNVPLAAYLRNCQNCGSSLWRTCWLYLLIFTCRHSDDTQASSSRRFTGIYYPFPSSSSAYAIREMTGRTLSSLYRVRWMCHQTLMPHLHVHVPHAHIKHLWEWHSRAPIALFLAWILHR